MSFPIPFPDPLPVQIEPCPIVQFAKESIHEEGRTLSEKFFQSEFLRDFRTLAQSTTRGCIVLERPDLLANLVVLHEAKDTTARQTAMAELQAMTTRTSQYNPGQAIPEKSWVYRLLKRYLFADFGVYDGHDHSQSAAPGLLRRPAPSDVPTAVL